MTTSTTVSTSITRRHPGHSSTWYSNSRHHWSKSNFSYAFTCYQPHKMAKTHPRRYKIPWFHSRCNTHSFHLTPTSPSPPFPSSNHRTKTNLFKYLIPSPTKACPYIGSQTRYPLNPWLTPPSPPWITDTLRNRIGSCSRLAVHSDTRYPWAPSCALLPITSPYSLRNWFDVRVYVSVWRCT